MSSRYRLLPLLKIKARARKFAELALAKAIGHLEKEKQRKTELEAEKDGLTQTKRDVRHTLDEQISTATSTIADSQGYIDYIKRLDTDIKQKERDTQRQQEVIDDAQIMVARARRDYVDAAKEHEMMEKHKELWEKRRDRELGLKEQRELDDLSQVIHQIGSKGAARYG